MGKGNKALNLKFIYIVTAITILILILVFGQYLATIVLKNLFIKTLSSELEKKK